MNLQIWNRTAKAMVAARALVCASRDRHMSGYGERVRRIVAKLSEAPTGHGRSQHACRLEVRTRDGEVLRVVAEDYRVRGAVDRAFRRAAQLLNGRVDGRVPTPGATSFPGTA